MSVCEERGERHGEFSWGRTIFTGLGRRRGWGVESLGRRRGWGVESLGRRREDEAGDEPHTFWSYCLICALITFCKFFGCLMRGYLEGE
ncbi:hypothetical protein HanRHA438_Chr15g0706281 [Helianthus annuus]|nr:hypothetical protein HanIR_Chr15g0754291 [Helianthus annuus]KAJ0844780.1 hypothetical protein HanRHA438_Chr15g0706281 [Helianthus annuus]